MKLPDELQGIVTDFQYGCYRVDCQTLIEHLKVVFVSRQQAWNVEIGDAVTLKYKSDNSSGLWYVSVKQ